LLGGGQEFPSAGTYPIDEHVILVAVAGPTTVVTETSRRGLMRLLSVRIQDFSLYRGFHRIPNHGCHLSRRQKRIREDGPLEGSLQTEAGCRKQGAVSNLRTIIPSGKWRPDQPIPANPPAVTTKWKLDAADVAVLEKQFGAGTIADHSFYDNEGPMLTTSDTTH